MALETTSMWRWRPLVGIALLALITPLLLLVTPVVLVAVVLTDLLTAHWRLPLARLWLFGLIYAGHQWAGLARFAHLTFTGRRRTLEAHSAVQAWWIGSLLASADRVLGIRLDWPTVDLPAGHLLILSRHSSPVDAVFPAYWMTALERRPAQYVMKSQLLFDPCIGLFGHRLGTAFIDRTSGDDATNAIRRLASRAAPDAALVVFPEGTYATPANRSRILDSLRAKANEGDEAHGAFRRASALQHLLPARPAGTMAALDQLPHAPVILLAPLGLEGFTGLAAMRKRIPLRTPVTMTTWILARSDIPHDEAGRRQWLDEQWRWLDDWLVEQLGPPARQAH